MPPADARTPQKSASPPTRATIAGWGQAGGASVSLLRPRTIDELQAALDLARSGAIPRGMGRSYGDAAQLTDGLVLELTRLRQLALDADRGVVSAQAGVTIGQLLETAVPAGWMVPVVPGTQHVSIGGAIAADIHGKNHGAAGTLGSHVQSLSLADAGGELHELTVADELFQATLGGMGLTGVIVSAKLQLRAVPGPQLSVDTDKVDSLDAALAALSAPGGPHRVAWLDLLGSRPVRGIVTRAEHAPAESDEGRATVRARATVPARWPGGLLRPATVRAFNALRYHAAPRLERGRLQSIGAHMFPLDGLGAWPRLYGRHGFLQYQLVVPSGAEPVLEAVIDRLRHSPVPCYLAVLKDLGPASGPPLSFPIKGWTITLDLPRSADGLYALLDGFDELVASSGGRVYLAKDDRLRPDALQAMYPRLDQWRTARDRADPERVWCSDLARRTGLV